MEVQEIKKEKSLLEEFEELRMLYRFLSIDKDNTVSIYSNLNAPLTISMDNDFVIMKRPNETPVRVKCNSMFLLGVVENLKIEKADDNCFENKWEELMSKSFTI